MTELIRSHVRPIDTSTLKLQWQAEQREAVAELRRVVALAVMLSEGSDGEVHPPSGSYSQAIKSRGGNVGLEVGVHRQPQAKTLEVMQGLIVARIVDGMIVQQPQPDLKGANPLDVLTPGLDVDASLAKSPFVRPTTLGVLRIEKQYPNDLNLRDGANVVVFGSDGRVGTSVSEALEGQRADVTRIDFWGRGHTQSDLRDAIKKADTLVTAYGREPGLIEEGWLHDDMTLIDMSYEPVTLPDGTNEIWGDIHPSVLESNLDITWVGPSAVGSAATSALIDNTILAAQNRR